MQWLWLCGLGGLRAEVVEFVAQLLHQFNNLLWIGLVCGFLGEIAPRLGFWRLGRPGRGRLLGHCSPNLSRLSAQCRLAAGLPADLRLSDGARLS